MKTKKTLFLSMLAIAVFASCSKTEEHSGLDSEKGEATQATFTINVAETGATKASSTNDGLLGESTIKIVNLYIFNKDNVLEDIKHITIVDENATFTIETTTGSKTIYAVINPPTDMQRLSSGYSLDKFKMLTVDASTTNISGTGAFTMIGSVEAKLTADATQANQLNIKASRMVAKVVMRYDDKKVKVSNSIVKWGGEFVNAGFLVVQTPKKSYLSPRDLTYSPTYMGNNLLDGANPGGDITQSPTDQATFEHLTSIDTTGIKPVSIGSEWNDNYDNSCYTAENVNRTPTTGNTTFTLVRLQYKMNNVDLGETVFAEFDQDGELHEIHTTSPDDNFGEGNKIVEYKNGYCYYRLNINDNTKLTDNLGQEKYNVLRNNLYQIDITMVSGLGSATIVDLGPTIAPGPNTLILQSADIVASVKVIPWTVVNMPSVLD